MNPKLLAFALATAALVYVSRKSLLAPRSHGFYRFFAWEAIVALITRNVEHWFYDPFSLHQMVSWMLLVGSLYLVVHGAYLLHAIGRPDRRRVDPTISGVERTTTLVTVGLYGYIRHPLYCSLLLFTWGVFLKDISMPATTLAFIATAFLVATARIEEIENVRFFGDPYLAYMKQTKMFIPYLL